MVRAHCPGARRLIPILAATALVWAPLPSIAAAAGSARPVAPVALDSELAAAAKEGPTSAQWPESDYGRLLDTGDVTIKPDGTIVGVYRETYRLFNERARPMAEVNLPYNSSYQSVKVLRARTIRKNGVVSNVRPQDIRDSSPYNEYLMYDDAMSITFSMPAIEDDCIIDYTYEMITRPLLLPGQYWTYWGFSGPEPVGVCRFTLHTPASKPMRYRVYNADGVQPTVVNSADGKMRTYSWEMRGIKPVPMEPAMPELSRVRSWMEVSSTDSWQDIAKWFWGLQSPQAVPDAAVRATVNTLIAGKANDEDKARAIYDWVANKTRYVGLEFGISAYKPHPASEVMEKLYGDCKDKATLLISMLGVAGIKANPVLLHAEQRDPIEQRLPALSAFNHCIALAEVGGKEVWLDATAETCAYGDIPDGDRGVQALVVRDGVGKLETIPGYRPDENGVDMDTRIAVHPDGSADVVNEMKWRGATGQQWRAEVRSVAPDKRKEMAQRLAQSFSVGAILKKFSVPDGTDKQGPFPVTLEAAAPSFAKKTNRLLLVPVSNWLSGSERRNPYLAERRVWPIVEQDTAMSRCTTNIELPEGYDIEDMPESLNLSCPLQEYHRIITKLDDGRHISVTETMVEHPGTVPVSDYATMRAYYDSILKSTDDQIVLKKK